MRIRIQSTLAILFLMVFGTAPIFAEEIRVGAWNIEWLGFADKRAKPGKDHPQAPKDLADYIHSSQVDVLSLEEIGVDNNVGPLKSAALQAVLDELKSEHGEEWEYVLFSKADYPEETEDFVRRGQHIGLAWRTDKATRVGEPFAIPVGASKTFGIKFWERRAHAVKLSFGPGKTDVVFVPVHMKSNRNESNPSDQKYTEKQRTAEINALVKQLQALRAHFQDDDIVVLGDTNVLANEDSTLTALLEAGFSDLNQDDRGTTAAWGEGYTSAPFDRILVPARQPEFRQSHQSIHILHDGSDEKIKEHRRKLSDHYLIWCTIEIGTDDD